MSERGIRILFAVNGLATGGAEIFLLRKIQQLRQRSNYAALAYCSRKGEAIDSYLGKYLQNQDIYQISEDSASIQPLLKQLDIGIFHTVQAHPSFLKSAKEVNSKIACVSTLTADLKPPDKKFNHRLYTDAVVAKSQKFLNIIKQGLENPPAKFVVIENGVDVERFSPARTNQAMKTKILKPLEIAENSRIVLHVGRIHPVKNLEDSLALAKNVRAQRGDSVFLFAGRHKDRHESYFKDLVDLREKLGLRDCFIFLGERADIADLLNISDCVISTTRAHEGTPNAILEALATAKPVVAFNCDGISDVVLHGRTGFVAEDVDEASGYVKTLLDDHLLRENMGRAARDYAVDRFDLNISVSRYEKFYRELLSGINTGAGRRLLITAGYLKHQIHRKVFNLNREQR